MKKRLLLIAAMVGVSLVGTSFGSPAPANEEGDWVCVTVRPLDTGVCMGDPDLGEWKIPLWQNCYRWTFTSPYGTTVAKPRETEVACPYLAPPVLGHCQGTTTLPPAACTVLDAV